MKTRQQSLARAGALQVVLALTVISGFTALLGSAQNPQSNGVATLDHLAQNQDLPNLETATPPLPFCDLAEGFDDITMLVPNGWFMQNNSQPLGTTGWLQGNSYIAANYQNGSGIATISNWLLTPQLILQDGAQLTFYTRTVDVPAFPDRLQVRMSINGKSTKVGSTATDVGDFSTLLLDINPTYTTSGYPSAWTQFTVNIGGLGMPTTGRLAFRYFVENGGAGANSDYIAIDTLNYSCAPATGRLR